jgi:hypothetical protein
METGTGGRMLKINILNILKYVWMILALAGNILLKLISLLIQTVMGLSLFVCGLLGFGVFFLFVLFILYCFVLAIFL